MVLFRYKSIGEESSFDLKSSRRRILRWSVALVLILLFILVVMTIFICLTYEMKLQCGTDDDSVKPLPSSENFVSFLLFSDIHLDLLYKPTAARGAFCRNESLTSYDAFYGRMGCDSPITLLRNALATMKNLTRNRNKFDFIVLTGDTSAHRLSNKSDVLKTISTSSKEIKSAFPSLPYFPCIGNNDLPAHYVMPAVNDTWYSDLLDIWQDGIVCTSCKDRYNTTSTDELRRTFLKGGYYSVNIAAGSMILLILNSMYWTESTWKPFSYFTEIAETQMKWLEGQLILAKKLNKRVLIASHIPPGIDTYVSKSLWLGNFTTQYVDLVANRFSDVVAGQLYAHYHRDSFRVVKDEAKDSKFGNSSFIILVPSISPVYNSNPGFRLVHLDTDRQAMIDYEQLYINLVMATEFNNPVWQLDYKFSEKYPAVRIKDKMINAIRIKELSENLINQTDDDIFVQFITSRQLRYQPDTPYSRFIYYCAVRYILQDDFHACQKKYSVPGG